MDRCRQQSAKGQRSYSKPCYQSKTQYGCDSMCNNMCDSYGNKYNINRSNYTNMGCNCKMEDCPGMEPDPIACMPLAMAYVPWQRFENLYDECEAVYHGTLFCDLDLDFYGKRCE